jgi:hypothetical protein
MYDCLRCNKAMSAWGVEPRVPFLDVDFLDVAMNLSPKEKMILKGPGVEKKDERIEKWAMRKAFDTPDDPYLPDEILWRQKEQFSDGKSLRPEKKVMDDVLDSSVLIKYIIFIRFLYRRWLCMGRPPESSCRKGDFRPNVCERRQSLPSQHPDNERRIPLPDDFRGEVSW